MKTKKQIEELAESKYLDLNERQAFIEGCKLYTIVKCDCTKNYSITEGGTYVRDTGVQQPNVDNTTTPPKRK